MALKEGARVRAMSEATAAEDIWMGGDGGRREVADGLGGGRGGRGRVRQRRRRIGTRGAEQVHVHQ